MREVQQVAWERPISAQVAGNPEVVLMELPNTSFAEQTESRVFPALEDLPGVRDVDRYAGVVLMEDGRTQSIGRLLGRQAAAEYAEGRES